MRYQIRRYSFILKVWYIEMHVRTIPNTFRLDSNPNLLATKDSDDPCCSSGRIQFVKEAGRWSVSLEPWVLFSALPVNFPLAMPQFVHL